MSRARARSSPRKSGTEAERVGIREREEVLRGAKEHGAGSAVPKERQARPATEVLAAFPVADDPNDADYGARTVKSAAASPAGGRKCKLAPPSLDVDTMSQLTWPTPTPSPTGTVTGPADGEHKGGSSYFDDSASLFIIQPGGLNPEATAAAGLTRTQRWVGLSLVALVGLFVVVQTISEAYPTYMWATALARSTARRLDVLYTAADGLALVFALALHVLVFVIQLAVAHLPQLVLGGMAVYVVVWRWNLQQQA